MRWLSFRCAFVILVLSLSLAPQARANPVCGDGANLGDLSLQTLVDTISEGLAQSELPPDGLKIALGVDVERLEKVRGDTSAEDLRNRIFYTACRVRLEKLKEQGSPLQVLHTQMRPFVEVLGQTAKIQRAMKGLNAGTDLAADTTTNTISNTVTNTDPNRVTGNSTVNSVEAVKPAARPKIAGSPKVQSPPQMKIGSSRSAKPGNGGAGNTGKAAPKSTVRKRAMRTRDFSFQAPTAGSEMTRAQECASIGVVGANDCTDFESVIKNLKESPLAYNHPKSMYLGKRTQISLVIKTGQDDHKKELEGLPGQVKTGTTKISRVMQAELSGAAFRIEPSGPQQRTITSLAPVKWTWFVTPTEEGEFKRLNLDLSAILREGTRDLPPVTIRTFSTQIEVDVRWWDLLIHRVSAFDPIYQLATAIGGVATALLFIWRLLSWRRTQASGNGRLD